MTHADCAGYAMTCLNICTARQGRHNKHGVDAHEGAAQLQARLMAVADRDPGLRALAADAFRAHVRPHFLATIRVERGFVHGRERRGQCPRVGYGLRLG